MSEDRNCDLGKKILDIIYDAIDELNEDLDNKIVKDPCTALLGQESGFDSLTLVNLIVATEQRVEDEFGFAISAIANEKAMSEKSSPLRTITTFSEFIEKVVGEQLVD